MQTFLDFKARLRAELWPSGEARSLRVVHDGYFNAAMLDIQKWVPCVRQFNTSTWEFGNTFWENAKTVVNAPWGKIKRVYTVAGGTDRWRDKVRYRSSIYAEIECWANRLFKAITPTNSASLPALQLGTRYANATQDSLGGRARIGIWAIDRKRLYIAPYLQSTETLVVDWDGLKSKWQDSDGVDEIYWTTDYEDAIKLYVMWKHESFHGNPQLARGFKLDYDAALADLTYICRENTKQQHDYTCDSGSGGQETIGLSQANIDDDDDPTEDTTDEDNVLFAAVGDMGDPTTEAGEVAAAIESDSPEFFFALGDNSYNGNYATDFGANYQWAIDAGIVVPVIGNHDVDATHGNSSADFRSYFSAFVSNNGEYYDKIIGPIHLFIYNTEDTAGIDVNSAQAEWLRARMFLSAARWKVVLMHRPPFSSDTTHGSDPDLQLPFGVWGADLVLAAHGHDYERLEVGGVPYVVVGTGGRPLYAFGSPVSGSLIRIANTFGRLIGTCNCDEMVLQFKDLTNAVLDTLTLTKT